MPSADLNWLKTPIAHRGLHDASRGIIENSSSAAEAAIAEGYAIEVDVRASAEGEPMVFHDAILERLTDATGEVAQTKAGELTQLTLKGSSDHILRLTELLELVGGRVPLLLEVKSDWSGRGKFETRIAARLRGYSGPVAVMSFDPRSVGAFAKLAPTLPRGLTASACAARDWPEFTWRQRWLLRNLTALSAAEAQFVAYDIRALPAAAPMLARTLFGRPLLTWTVRSDAERRKAARWADAMIFEGFRPEH